MSYTDSIRPPLADIPHIVHHREAMFRDMGIPAAFDDMAAAMELWLRHAIPVEDLSGLGGRSRPAARSPPAAG